MHEVILYVTLLTKTWMPWKSMYLFMILMSISQEYEAGLHKKYLASSHYIPLTDGIWQFWLIFERRKGIARHVWRGWKKEVSWMTETWRNIISQADVDVEIPSYIEQLHVWHTHGNLASTTKEFQRLFPQRVYLSSSRRHVLREWCIWHRDLLKENQSIE